MGHLEQSYRWMLQRARAGADSPKPPETPTAQDVLGLDLGQSMGFSALVALRKRAKHYKVRGIKRWPLRTPYTTIVADVVALLSRPPLSGCNLGVDRTGCGQPVVDMLRAGKPKAILRPILITA